MTKQKSPIPKLLNAYNFKKLQFEILIVTAALLHSTAKYLITFTTKCLTLAAVAANRAALKAILKKIVLFC